MALIHYSDSEDDNEDEHDADQDDVAEITDKLGIEHQFNFKATSGDKTNDTVSFDFGTTSTKKSLFDSLPLPKSSSPQNTANTKKKKKKKRKKKKKGEKNDKKRKREQLSLIDILPQPKHKKAKIEQAPQPIHSSEKEKISIAENKNDDAIQTNDIRKKQAEVHRKYSNPMASFSISDNDKTTNDESKQEDGYKNVKCIKPPMISRRTNGHGVEMKTASSIYRVGDNNEYTSLPSELPEYAQYVHAKQKNLQIESEQIKNHEEDEIITISQNDQLAQKNGKEWLPAFEIDDITRTEIKMVPTKTYNPDTGKVEIVKKYTKTQRKKHQINTLAYESQEKALQLAMRRAANYKTKAETQAKYGW